MRWAGTTRSPRTAGARSERDGPGPGPAPQTARPRDNNPGGRAVTPAIAALWAGLAIGLAFGVAGRLTGFCLTSGLRGWWAERDGRMIRAFAMALAVALVGSQALEALGLIAMHRSHYMQASFSPALLALGGLLFGYGMVMANGCGARALVLLGGGNLRSFVVLACLAIAGKATLTGLLAPARLWAGAVLPVQSAGIAPPSLPGLLAGLGLEGLFSIWLPTLLLAGFLAIFALRHRPFRQSPALVLGGAGIGLLVVAGWYATGVIGHDDFDPVPLASLTFIAPVSDSFLYAMLSTGTALGFGVAVVAGIVCGAAATAVLTGHFQLEGFTSPRSMLRYMAGGTLMGIGGALALGCSIGQGLTGLSTLALTAFPAAAGILAGAAIGLRGPLRLTRPNP